MLKDGSKKRVSNYEEYAELVHNVSYEEARRVKYEKDRVVVSYRGRKVFLCYSDMPTRNIATLEADQNFSGESVDALDVKGKTVIDIGSSIADTPIRFALDGAKKVMAYEPQKKLHALAKKNVRINHLEGSIILINKAVIKLSELDKHRGDVIKCDIDGGEYDLFLKASDKTLAQYSEILLEYHRGYKDLVKKLEGAGFKVSKTRPVRSQDIGKNETLWNGNILATKEGTKKVSANF